MTAKELAAALDGIEYPIRIPNHLAAKAKEAGLVIVYGASDDLMEFDGAFRDEAAAYEGGIVRIDQHGIVPDFGQIEHEVAECQKWIERDKNAKEIEALWCAEEGYSFTYKTTIPHETFEVMEDGEHYCRGIVYAVVDLAIA